MAVALNTSNYLAIYVYIYTYMYTFICAITMTLYKCGYKLSAKHQYLFKHSFKITPISKHQCLLYPCIQFWAEPSQLKQSYTHIYIFIYIYIYIFIYIYIYLYTYIHINIFTVLSWASPLTYQVIGHIKTIIILITGVFLYDDIPTGKSVLGKLLKYGYEFIDIKVYVICIYIHVDVYTHVDTYVCIYICVNMNIYIYEYMYKYIDRVFLYDDMFTGRSALGTSISIYICTYMYIY
jgi:hypothetical protein